MMNIMDDTLQKYREKANVFKREYGKLIICCFFLGVISYFPLITRPLTNADGITISVTYKSSHDWENSLGRFGIQYMDQLHGNFIFPELTTCFCLFLLSWIVILTVKIFDIHRKSARLAAGMLLILSPSVSNTLTYYYCSDSYMAAYLLAVLAAFLMLTRTGVLSWVTAVAAVTLSLTLYQAYVGVTITLCLFWTIKHCLTGTITSKRLFVSIARALIGGALGVLLYLFLFKIYQIITGTVAADNRGFNHMGVLPWKEVPLLLKQACLASLQYFFSDELFNNSWLHRNLFNLIMVGLGFWAVVLLLRQNRMVLTKWKYLLVLPGILTIPLALGCIVILAPEANIYEATGLLMLPQMNYAYVFVISLYASLSMEKMWSRIIFVLEKIVVIMILAISVVFAGAFQSLLRINADKTYYVASEILHHITEEDYDSDRPLMISGQMEKGNFPDLYQKLNWAMDGTIASYGLIWTSPSASQGCWNRVFRQCFGVEYTMCSEEEYNEILETEEFQMMSNFPEENSIKVINGVMVVKLSP